MQLAGKMNLVVCQKSKVEDWVNHFKQHYSNTVVWNLTSKKEFDDWILFCVDEFIHVCVINYDLIFRRPELAKAVFDTIMLDESSLIQNEQAKRSRFILRRIRHNNCILLSGTPTGGKYEKLWSQCRLLGWEISKEAFWNTYVRYHFQDFNGFPQKVIDGYKNVERLKAKLREHGAVFMKSEEVFDLPEQLFSDIRVTTTTAYKKFAKTSIIDYEGRKLVGDTTLTKMLYLRMLCAPAKLDAYRDILSSTDDRLIVFYNFNSELKALVEATDRPISIVSGQEKDLEEYEKSEDSVTFIQYQAGSMGLNLQKANKIIYFSPPVSSELFEQSKKRIHRIGQIRPCFYYRLICKDSIEERIYKVLEMRKDYTERLFEGGE